ncbi:hypothetical protein PCASD_10191 [Puccinia coronata f. sp. avenae]|uniref:Uncharacterized protein n=1 Tax=Puccinia coronata f. sp. avenae TaxID=200324 RepID=A0A2N5UGN1_9BASI|nr:hypothetical protein PCASD_10191 [Puccinia coronata f. sp. avenae]
MGRTGAAWIKCSPQGLLFRGITFPTIYLFYNSTINASSNCHNQTSLSRLQEISSNSRNHQQTPEKPKEPCQPLATPLATEKALRSQRDPICPTTPSPSPQPQQYI